MVSDTREATPNESAAQNVCPLSSAPANPLSSQARGSRAPALRCAQGGGLERIVHVKAAPLCVPPWGQKHGVSTRLCGLLHWASHAADSSSTLKGDVLPARGTSSGGLTIGLAAIGIVFRMTMSSSTRRPVRFGIRTLASAILLLSVTACQDALAHKPAAGTVKPTSGPAASSTSTKANHVENLDPADIYGLATKANADASSFRERMVRKEAATDLRISATECVGTVDMRGEGTYRLVLKDRDMWALPDKNFLRVFAANGIKIAEGTWLHGPVNNSFMADLASFCRVEQFTDPDTASTAMTKGKVTSFDGQDAIPVTSRIGTRSRIYYVATTGVPHLLAMKSRGNIAVGDLTYSEFGTPVNAKAPSGNTVEAPPF